MSCPTSHRFSNGFRVIYQESLQSVPVSSIHVFCDVGSIFETDGIRGASHLVEHMCFKGTDTIREARNLLIQYNKIGADFNAYTEKRFTTYHINCDDTYVLPCMKLMSDMILHSVFSKKEFYKEQQVVIEEQIRGQDNHISILADDMDAIYYKGSPYANPIDHISYHPTPTHLSYEDIFKWYKWFYHPSNMVCSIVTNLPFSTVISMLKKTKFMDPPPKECPQLPFAFPKPTLSLAPISSGKPCIQYIQKKGVAATVLAIGFRTCSIQSPDKYPLMVLQQILNGFSGRLFTALRTKRGLTYSSICTVDFNEHAGYLQIRVLTDPRRLIQEDCDGVLPVLVHMIEELQRKGVTAEEVRHAKGGLKGTYLLNLQSNDAIATYNGSHIILTNQPPKVSFQDVYDTYLAKVTKAEIDRVIQTYLCKENLLVGILYDHAIPKKKMEEIVDRVE
jgi:predicted Zn-dependent peptidase